jgi:PHP family Zn ribbon phosphoesterase
MYRIEELSHRKIAAIIRKDRQGVRWVYHPKNDRPPFVNIVPLLEIIGEAFHIGTASQKAQNVYDKITTELAGEFNVLLKSSLEDITKVSSKDIARAVAKVRAGDIVIDPGYDGVFGKVTVWDHEDNTKEHIDKKDQMSLF